MDPDNVNVSVSLEEQDQLFSKYSSLIKDGDHGVNLEQFSKLLETWVYNPINRRIDREHTSTLNIDIDTSAESRYTQQEEFQLFQIFDMNNDGFLDREEFASLCDNWLVSIYHPKKALVIVDVQNDFIDGSLALINGPAKQDGVDVVPVINKILAECKFDAIIYTQDWHPIDHIGFYENLHLRKFQPKHQDQHEDQPGATGDPKMDNEFKLKKLPSAQGIKPFQTVLFDDGRMEQILWPTHCVQNSWGAELHSKLNKLKDAIYIRKGTLSNVDAYSAFWDNRRLNETDLRRELESRKITDVYFCGLALDYCVAASALDSARAGFVTYVIEDACRGIDREEISKRQREMLEQGVFILKTENIAEYLSFDSSYMNNEDMKSDRLSSTRSILDVHLRRARLFAERNGSCYQRSSSGSPGGIIGD